MGIFILIYLFFLILGDHFTQLLQNTLDEVIPFPAHYRVDFIFQMPVNMKILLDTNIIIHREATKVINQDIGELFHWLDKLHYTKTVHPLTAEELSKNKEPNAVITMLAKLKSYTVIKSTAPLNSTLSEICKSFDSVPNDQNDNLLLNEVYCDRVEILISEDNKIHLKAKALGIGDRVFKIDQFLEKVVSENPSFVDYKVLAIRKNYFGEIDLSSPFFDSFREDYAGFDKWFNKKADELAYVCNVDGLIAAFLYLKIEDEKESYYDISPPFAQKKRLKIGTLKVSSNGYKIGERFLNIIFDNALLYKVDEIYVTIFDKRPEQIRLIHLLEDWGFCYYGLKTTNGFEENVYIKNFNRKQEVNLALPKKTFPFSSSENKIFIVPIYPEYHTELFPDSILRTESSLDYIENEPHRNALSKVYISHSRQRNLKPGDLIIFYRTGGIYKGVVSTIGIVESMTDNIPDEKTFLRICRKRSIFSDQQLLEYWNLRPNNRPFVVNFLFTHSLKKRPNLKWLNENGIIPDIQDMPRGFREISRENFIKIVNYSRGK